MFPIFTVVFVLSLLFAGRIAYLRKKEAREDSEFWEREKAANLTPKRDITNLPYINIPIDKFPFDSCSLPAEEADIEMLRSLSGQKILNLVGKTNTDLKEAYGPQNLPELQACGDRFDQLETTLLHLGQSRISAEDYPSALRFLEYAAGIRSDISTVYTALGDCYAALGQPRKIKNLISTVPSANLMLENKVLDHLNKLLPPELPPEENFTSEDK